MNSITLIAQDMERRREGVPGNTTNFAREVILRGKLPQHFLSSFVPQPSSDLAGAYLF